MSGRSFGFTLTYRPVSREMVTEPDERPVEGLPQCQYAARASAAERERYLVGECQQLEAQGYRIERVERWNRCARCEGAGSVVRDLKGTKRSKQRRRFSFERVPCQACGGGGAEHTVESISDPAFTPGGTLR